MTADTTPSQVKRCATLSALVELLAQLAHPVGRTWGPAPRTSWDTALPPPLVGLPRAARRRCRRRSGDGLQRADRRRGVRAGGAGATLRHAHRDRHLRRL